MKTSTEQWNTQANRVADVSDALDDLPRERARLVWAAAQETYEEGVVSFLAAFEDALRREPGWPDDM